MERIRIRLPESRFLALFTAAYVILGYAGDLLSARHGLTGAWLPGGLLLGTLIASRRREWPAYILAALAASLVLGAFDRHGLWLDVGLCAGHALEALLGAVLFNRFVGEKHDMTRPAHVVGLFTTCALIAPIPSALVNIQLMRLFDPSVELMQASRLWYSGDALGVMVMAPLAITLGSQIGRRELLSAAPRTYAERVVLLAVCCAVALYVFGPSAADNPPHKWLLALVLVMCAWRLGPIGTAITGAAVAVFALVNVGSASPALGLRATQEERVVLLHVYLTVSLFAAHLMSAAVTRLRIAEQRALEEKDRVRDLAGQLADTEDRERKAIAMELHDRVCQPLAVAKLKVQKASAAQGGGEYSVLLDEAARLVTDGIDESRQLMHELSPPALYELGLPAALEWLVQNVHGAVTGPSVALDCDPGVATLPEPLQVALYMCTRELLANAARHSGAENVEVHCSMMVDSAVVIVADDGRGFPAPSRHSPDERRTGFGLFVVRERMARVGGAVDIQTDSGLGSTVTLRAPIAEATEGLAGTP